MDGGEKEVKDYVEVNEKKCVEVHNCMCVKEMRITLKNGVTLEFDSTGMAEDFKECARMAEETDCEDGKDCKTCKCNKVVGDIGLCEIPEVAEVLELEEEKNEKRKVRTDAWKKS